MDFALNEEQQMLQDTAARLVRDNYGFEAREQFAKSELGYSLAFWQKMGELGLTTEEVQKGMSTDAMATMDKIIAAIGKLPSDQRIGVMVELVGLEHSDTLAKLVDKPEELARQRKLANGGEAKGSMSREAAARNAALSAQWQMTKNRAFNLGSTIGETLAPALLKLLNIVNPMLESFTKWVQENPTLVKWVLATVVGLSGLLAVLGLIATSILGLALTDFSTQQWLAWGLMTLLGFSVASALLASSSAIMAAAPKEKAAAAGAIETMAYELGAGLGIALFGLILTRSYTSSIVLPGGD